MNRHQKKVLTLAGAIANLSFTCVVAGVATYAWFNENRDVYADGVSIRAEGPEILLDYQVLKYDDDQKKGIAAYDNDSQKWEFVLPEYDEYIKSRNVYSNLIVRAELTFSHEIDTTEKAIEIDITKFSDSVLKDNGEIQKLTSNVAQFKCIATSYTPSNSNVAVPIGVGIVETHTQGDDYKDDIDAMYKSATTYFASRKTPSTFISLVNGQPVDPDNGTTITVVPELYNVGPIKKAVVYLECSYNEQLATGFVNNHPDESLHDLVGDIQNITFYIRNFANEQFGERNTGQYIRMNSVGQSYDGKYLPTYIGTGTNQQVLDGDKTTGLETIENASGINTNNNQFGISNYISKNQTKIYASDRIDDASFTFNRLKGTYQSEKGHFIGTNSLTDGIISNTSSANLTNSLEYSDQNATIKSVSKPSMKMQYDSANSKFAYYSATKQNISLYRFHENDIINATLSSIQLTAPTGDNASFRVGGYFELKGVTVMATYNKTGGGSFTINVTQLCTYSTNPEGTLIPDQTMFTNPGNPKTINVSYTDGSETRNASYTVSVIADTLLGITITSPITKQFYLRGDNFDTSGLVVTGSFSVTGQSDVTSQCVFLINQVQYNNGSPLNIAGNNLTVTVHYNGTATLGPDYVDRTFNITITDTIIEITESSEIIDVNESLTLHFTYNSYVTWTISNTTGELSFAGGSTVVTSSTNYTGANHQSVTGEIVVYGRSGGTATVTASVAGGNTDTCTVTIRDNTATSATYTVETKTTVATTGTVPQGSTATFVNTGSNAVDQLGTGATMTLTLDGYEGYRVTRIVLNMRSSNNGTGAGTFSATAGGTVISQINPAAQFKDPQWYGSDSGSNYVDVEPTVTLSKRVGTGEKVILIIAGTAPSLFCASFTIYYEQAAVATVSSLVIKDGDTDITSTTKTIDSGVIGTTWTPNAIVTYSDTTSDHAVTWEITSGQNNDNITINSTTGLITLNTASGTATIKATTIGLDSNGEHVEKTFIISWSNLTKVLTGIEVTGQTVSYTVGETFTFDGTVTASYNDGSSADVTNSVSVSSPNMSTAGSKTITVSYTEGGVTKEFEYTINVTGNYPYTGDYTWDLSIASYNSNPTESLVTWSAACATMESIRVGSATAVNNYLGGDANNRTSSRFYTGNTLRITPSTNYSITKIEFTATTTDYATALNGSTWTNATSSVSGTKVTVTPTNGENVISATIGGTCGFTGVKVFYATSVEPPLTVTSIAVKTPPSKVTYDAGECFNPAGLVITVTYSDNSTDDIAYSQATANDFSFSPSTSTQLTTSNHSVTITYGGESCTQNITVNGQVTAHYERITSLDDLVSGGTYLIVCENNNVAFNGGLATLDAVGNKISVTITNHTIESNSTTDAAVFTITKSGNNYYIQSASGKYIGRSSNSNGLDSSNSALANTITFNGNNVIITGTSGRVLYYNSTSGQTRFRYFGSTQQSIQLYILVS